MKPQKFNEANKTYVIPNTPGSELPTFQDETQIVSCWKPTDLEKLSILFHGRVYLGVTGKAQPPVWLSGINPFSEDGKAKDIPKQMELYFERKIKQFLIQNLKTSDEMMEIDFYTSDQAKRLLTDFINFLFDLKTMEETEKENV